MYLFHLLNKIIISVYTQNDAIELLRCYIIGWYTTEIQIDDI
jgi:hypothetical protein